MAKRLRNEPAETGDNSGGMIDGDALKRYVERGVSIRAEMNTLSDDLKELCKEADDSGACSKRELRKLIGEAMMDQDVLVAQLERMDTLRAALGGLLETPLGEAAMVRQENGRDRRGTGRAQDMIDAAREHLGGEA